ncbi:hypothetical protein AP41_04064 [Mycobacterium tuberculosis H3005]|nr:hypothetical protein AP41_04064 [Mycobacterium tuberculosis H3005]
MRRRRKCPTARVVRPKTPRGDGNSSTIASMSMSHSPSRQTQNPERGRKHFDDNSLTTNFQSRQTQNPERGRKLEHGAVHMPWLRGVVRPKTPRGDGNNTSVARHTPTNHQVVRPKTPRGDGNFSDHLCGISGLRSSDPKPREGTETPMRRHFRLQFQPVVRPKTPRGDGNLRRASTRGCRLRWSSDPKPREGTETRR